MEVESGYSDEFFVVHLYSHVLYAAVSTEKVKKGLFHEILKADDLVLMCDSMKDFANWKNS